MSDHDVDSDIGPESEHRLRAALRDLRVPESAPDHLHAHVERLVAEAAAGQAGPSWRERLRARALLLAEIAAVVALLAIGAGIIAMRTAIAPALATPRPTLDGTPGPSFPAPATGTSRATTGGWSSGLAAFAVVGDTEVRLTADGGASWSETRRLPVGVDLGLAFFDVESGYTMGADEVAGGSRLTAYRTADGGRTWLPTVVAVVPHTADEDVWAQIHYSDREHGVVLATAAFQPPPADSGEPAAPIELRSCRVFTTDDAGASWSAGGEVTCYGLPMVTWSTDLTGFTASWCTGCGIGVTEDGGRTWTTGTVPNVSSEVEFWPRLLLADRPGHLRLVGGYVRSGRGETLPRPLVVLASDDGGATWTEDYRSSTVDGPSLNSIWSFDAEHWLALENVSVEERPYQATRLIESWDAGRTWEAVDSTGFSMAGSMSWADRRHGMLQGIDTGDCTDTSRSCAGSGTIFLTNDGGRTWHAVPF